VRRSNGLRRIAAAVALLGAACAPVSFPGQPVGALRLSQVADQGDAERRSSMQLVLRGLESDADARPHEALSDYQTALRVDPGNPYAYLALARHHVYGRTPERALDFLDKAESLLRAQGAWAPPVEAQVVGLRGAALSFMGRPGDAAPLLERARTIDPWVWNDGALGAAELR
jgi:tetratricopeptide (TPR) repeat protein